MFKKTSSQKSRPAVFACGLALIFTTSVAFMAACSDSATPSLPTDMSGENLDSSNSSQTPRSSSAPAKPPFDVNSLSGDYSASASLSYQVSGIAAFGPFQTGASVSVYGLDTSTMAHSPSAVRSTVSSNKGNFTSQGALTSNYGYIEVSGSYYNFKRQDVATITMKAAMNMQGRTSANVNILTRLAYDRIAYLVAMESMDFSEAKKKAEKEVQAALGLVYDPTPFEDINMNTEGQAGANLVIATIALMLENNPADAATNINAIAADIASDGAWNDESLRAKVGDAFFNQNLYTITGVIAKNVGNSNITPSYLKPINVLAVLYGLGECTEENEGATALNSNTQSAEYGKTFICKDSSWNQVSAAAVYNDEVAKSLGECNSSREGETSTYEGSSVICKSNYWKKMTEEEQVNATVSKEKGACASSNNLAVVSLSSVYYQCLNSMWRKLTKTPVDYSKGRAMNKKLGRGINFGNSWDSEGSGGSGDCGWSNCIQDNWFKIAKDAGFNSIRLPVRWEKDASGSGSGASINSARMAGVKSDIDLALAQGLVVIIDAHHHNTLNDAAAKYSSNQSAYNSEKQKFVAMWSQIASQLNSYSDDKIVLEILNEPHNIQQAQINDLMTAAYQAIRSKAPGKTIMFESAGYSKFNQIPKLDLPNDGNIIVSGHYYDPYTFTHQGHNYNKDASATFSTSTIANDFKSYADDIAATFPDINGGCVPINMGEFGVSISNGNSGSAISDTKRAQWTNAVIQAAEQYGFSWHYWGFAGVGGFEAYNKNSNSWYSELKGVLDNYLKKASAVR